MSPEQQGEVASHFPLLTLLSQVLVAFTIEFDNEFEHRMPHRTTNHGSTPNAKLAPWHVSLVMWSNCMQFISKEGITVSELQRIAHTRTNFSGMLRWGYITIKPDPSDNRSKRPQPDALIRPTLAGRKAQEIWRPLSGIIEERWLARFGKDEIDQLRAALWALINQFNIELPDCLPILGYGLFSQERRLDTDRFLATQIEHKRTDDRASHLPLSALLSKVLLAFAIQFEHESDVSLAISANILRVLDEQGVRVRDLPLLTGVSKEAINMAMSVIQKRQFAVIEPDPTSSRFKVIRLTPKGCEARDAALLLIGVLEEHWLAHFGKDQIRNLREPLEHLVGTPTAQLSPLFKGLVPYPEGWRAAVQRPATLPHYPMILHRGGFPDGS